MQDLLHVGMGHKTARFFLVLTASGRPLDGLKINVDALIASRDVQSRDKNFLIARDSGIV